MQYVRSEAISHYLHLTAGVKPLAAGVLSLSEKPGPVFTAFPYPDQGADGAVSGYGPSFPFRVRLIADDPACAFLWDVARGRRIGADAETVLYRVERFAGAPYLARRMRVAAVVEEISAPPGETVTISGCFRQLGDAVEGTFDPETLAFTAA